MQENVELAFKKFKQILTKNKLQENVEYETNFKLQDFSQFLNIEKIKFKLQSNQSGSSPFLGVKCYSSTDSGFIAFAIPEYTLDKYDKQGIYSDKNSKHFMSPNTYNLDLFQSFLRQAKLKKSN